MLVVSQILFTMAMIALFRILVLPKMHIWKYSSIKHNRNLQAYNKELEAVYQSFWEYIFDPVDQYKKIFRLLKKILLLLFGVYMTLTMSEWMLGKSYYQFLKGLYWLILVCTIISMVKSYYKYECGIDHRY
jgi:hypothetical protein